MLQREKLLAAGITNLYHKFNLKMPIGESEVVTLLRTWIRKFAKQFKRDFS